MKRSGYTLFEVVLVMAIMLIVAALAAPMVFDAMYTGTKINAAADMVRARWADCQAHAIDEEQPYRFAVIPNTGKFKIEPWPHAYDDMGGAPVAPNGQEKPKGITHEDKLPIGVRFGTKEVPVNPNSEEADGGDYVTVAIFMPNGLAKNDVEITFGGGPGVASVTIHLESASGNAYVVDPNSQK